MDTELQYNRYKNATTGVYSNKYLPKSIMAATKVGGKKIGERKLAGKLAAMNCQKLTDKQLMKNAIH